jgi:hypothetical protein
MGPPCLIVDLGLRIVDQENKKTPCQLGQRVSRFHPSWFPKSSKTISLAVNGADRGAILSMNCSLQFAISGARFRGVFSGLQRDGLSASDPSSLALPRHLLVPVNAFTNMPM